jgi:DNA modification methylase
MGEVLLYNCNCLDYLSNCEKDIHSFVLSSPPYSCIRSYNGIIDKTKSFNGGYSFDFENIALELTRTLKPGGIIAWVVADQYIKGGRDLSSAKQSLFFVEKCGLRLHDHIIYQKSGFNFPANNRYHQVWENIFIFSKGTPKTFNPLMDRPNKYVGAKPHGRHRGADENDYKDMSLIVKAKPVAEFGKRFNVWYYKVGGGHMTKDKCAYKHPACVDTETECLTHLGWKKKTDLIIGENIISFNLESRILEWDTLDNIVSYDVINEEIISVEGRHLSMRLSKNHRSIYSNSYNQQALRIKNAEDLCQSDSIPCAAPLLNKNYITNISENEAKFLAWLISEGNVRYRRDGSAWGLFINQSTDVNRPFVEKIRTLLGDMHLRFTYHEKKSNYTYKGKTQIKTCATFYIPDKGNEVFMNRIVSLIGKDKSIPISLLRHSNEIIKEFLFTFREGDGSKGERFVIQQKSKKSLDILQAMGCILGYDAYIHYGKNGKGSSVEFTKKNHKLLRNTGSLLENIFYTGTLWCPVVNKNKTFLARRNGRVFITGNCFSESMAQDLILSYSNPGDLILDPFNGSGTSAKMAYILNRHFVGCELSEDYCEISKQRLLENFGIDVPILKL